MYIRVPKTLLMNPIARDSECMNTFLLLYSNCLSNHKYIPAYKKFQLAKDEIIATKSYLSKILGCTENSAQSYLRRLTSAGLISIRKDGCTNIIRVNTIRQNADIPTLNIVLPGNPLDYLEKKCRNIFKVYLNLSLFATPTDSENVFSGIKTSRGEMFTSLKTLANRISCSIQEIRTVIKKLIHSGSIVVEGIKRIGIKIKMLLYPKEREIKKPQTYHSLPVDPVTMGMKTLYFDLKKNKDMDRFEELTSQVRSNLPNDFPIENIEKALVEYFHKSGGMNGPWLQYKDIIKYLNDYATSIKQTQLEEERHKNLIDKRNNLLSMINDNGIHIKKLWNEASDTYEQYKTKGTINSNQNQSELYQFLCETGLCHIPTEYIDKVYPVVSSTCNSKIKKLFDIIPKDYFISGLNQAQQEQTEIINEINNTTLSITIPKTVTQHSQKIFDHLVQIISKENLTFARTYLTPSCSYLWSHICIDCISDITIAVPNNFVLEEWTKLLKLNNNFIERVITSLFGKWRIKFYIPPKEE